MGEDTVEKAKSKKLEKLLKGSQKFASASETPYIRDEKADISAYSQSFWMVLCKGRTPAPGALGQYFEKYGVQYCVLLFGADVWAV